MLKYLLQSAVGCYSQTKLSQYIRPKIFLLNEANWTVDKSINDDET